MEFKIQAKVDETVILKHDKSFTIKSDRFTPEFISENCVTKDHIKELIDDELCFGDLADDINDFFTKEFNYNEFDIVTQQILNFYEIVEYLSQFLKPIKAKPELSCCDYAKDKMYTFCYHCGTKIIYP